MRPLSRISIAECTLLKRVILYVRGVGVGGDEMGEAESCVRAHLPMYEGVCIGGPTTVELFRKLNSTQTCVLSQEGEAVQGQGLRRPALLAPKEKEAGQLRCHYWRPTVFQRELGGIKTARHTSKEKGPETKRYTICSCWGFSCFIVALCGALCWGGLRASGIDP